MGNDGITPSVITRVRKRPGVLEMQAHPVDALDFQRRMLP
jgi:hypothetical protein